MTIMGRIHTAEKPIELPPLATNALTGDRRAEIGL